VHGTIRADFSSVVIELGVRRWNYDLDLVLISVVLNLRIMDLDSMIPESVDLNLDSNLEKKSPWTWTCHFGT